MESFYGKDFFEGYGKGKGYRWNTMYIVLEPFATSIAELSSLMGNKPCIRAVDVGCAKGYLVKMLRHKGIEAYGVDVSEYAINHAPNEVKPYLYRVNIETAALPFKSQFFDLALCMAIFEHLHIEKLPFCLSNISRTMKHAGLLIINVPNPYNKTEAKKDSSHITMLSRRGWVKLIENSGFHYNSRLTSFFEKVRIREIADLYMSLHHNFQLIGINFCLPERAKAVVSTLMVLKRKLFAPNFSLIFSKA